MAILSINKQSQEDWQGLRSILSLKINWTLPQVSVSEQPLVGLCKVLGGDLVLVFENCKCLSPTFD